MASSIFHFKEFSIHQDKCSMKVGTDGVLLGAWTKIPTIPQLNILDIGTGTGLIALMIAQRIQKNKNKDFLIDAVDIDENSCLQATYNVKNSRFFNNIHIIHSSITNIAERSFPESYDLIISNPPYFNNSLKSNDKRKNIARHSDSTELGTATLIFSTKKLLNKKGIFSLILPNTEGEQFIKEADQNGLYCTCLTKVFPKPGKACMRYLMQFEKVRKNMEQDVLYVESGKVLNDFTTEYRKLTRDFYLKF